MTSTTIECVLRRILQFFLFTAVKCDYYAVMKRINTPYYLILGLMAGLLCFDASAQQKIVKTVRPGATSSLDGKSLFQEYCAVCHGKDAKGGGPAADALKQRPADLTQINRKNNGRFPDTKILAILKGEQTVTAHGNQDMPTWGKTFSDMNVNPNVGQGRMNALVMYLQEIQAK
jgi:mono/diheme cytochrome c family protein